MIFCCIPAYAGAELQTSEGLVKGLFPRRAASITDDLSEAVLGKTLILEEHVRHNPHEAVKVSQELKRCVRSSLERSEMSNVKIGVHAFQVLMSGTGSEEATTISSVVSQELMHGDMVGTLLGIQHRGVQALGAELIGTFIKHKVPCFSEGKELDELDKLQTLVCKIIDVADCLESQPEHEQLQRDNSMREAGVRSWSTAELAEVTLQNAQTFMEEVASIQAVLDTLFCHIDKKGGWENPSEVEATLRIATRLCSNKAFQVYAALMRRSWHPALAQKEREMVIHKANEQGAAYPLLAISVCLRELPQPLATLASSEQCSGPESGHNSLHRLILHTISDNASRIGDVSALLEVVGATLATSTVSVPPCGDDTNPPPLLETARFECSHAALTAIRSYDRQSRILEAKVFPKSLLDTLGDVLVRKTSEQRVQELSLEMLRLLLDCVEDGIRDGHQAVLLLNIVHAQAHRSGLQPPDYELLGRIVFCVIRVASPAVIILAMRVMVTLRNECCQVPHGELRRLESVEICSVLKLSCSALRSILQSFGDQGTYAVPLLPPHVQEKLDDALPTMQLVPFENPGELPKTGGPLQALSKAHDLGDQARASSGALVESLRDPALCSSEWIETLAASFSTFERSLQNYAPSLLQALKEAVTLSSFSLDVPEPGSSNVDAPHGEPQKKSNKALSWGATQASIRREGRKLNKVMDILRTHSSDDLSRSCSTSSSLRLVFENDN
eukprot:gene1687-33083_t